MDDQFHINIRGKQNRMADNSSPSTVFGVVGHFPPSILQFNYIILFII